jgi:methionyl aminopeptidase
MSFTFKDYMKWSLEIHDKVEDELRLICIPGSKVIEIVLYIENRIDELTDEYVEKYNLGYDFFRGKAFPVGININNIAAHWSPLTESELDLSSNYIVQQLDVVTIDYGIHFDGYILDAAFTFAYDERHRELLQCGLDACQLSAQMVKAGLPIYSLSKNIVKIANKYGFDTIKDLCGHQITQNKIHNGFVIPNCDLNLKKNISVGSIFTIEPFITTKKSNIKYTTDISHYMFNYHSFDYNKLLKLNKIPDFLKEYKTLAFNKRHIEYHNHSELDELVKKNIYQAYPPILESDNSTYVCQFETTLYVESESNVINYKKHKNIDHYLLLNQI